MEPDETSFRDHKADIVFRDEYGNTLIVGASVYHKSWARAAIGVQPDSIGECHAVHLDEYQLAEIILGLIRLLSAEEVKALVSRIPDR